ncbi:MAG TPA: response regulator transcription factor [Ktedonobacterales bacterium]|jgi:DNA-binding response OmpR family regulator|nr:response regulator transcription factor [Ktedonobacterales bacterium]
MSDGIPPAQAGQSAQTVLVVDDDPAIVELLRDFLVASDFRALEATNGQEALDIIAREPVDCLIMDVMMPGLSGFDLCRQIRARHDAPILFLSARADETDKIRGLMLGGDDYIVKATATPNEIVARVKAVLRRYAAGHATRRATYDFGRFSLDPVAHEVRVEGVPVPLAAREYAILLLLVEHPRQVFTQDDLFDRFWEGIGDRHAVAVYINRIRQKIEVDSAAPQYIVTVRGVGYRFEGGHP